MPGGWLFLAGDAETHVRADTERAAARAGTLQDDKKEVIGAKTWTGAM